MRRQLPKELPTSRDLELLKQRATQYYLDHQCDVSEAWFITVYDYIVKQQTAVKEMQNVKLN